MVYSIACAQKLMGNVGSSTTASNFPSCMIKCDLLNYNLPVAPCVAASYDASSNACTLFTSVTGSSADPNWGSAIAQTLIAGGGPASGGGVGGVLGNGGNGTGGGSGSGGGGGGGGNGQGSGNYGASGGTSYVVSTYTSGGKVYTSTYATVTVPGAGSNPVTEYLYSTAIGTDGQLTTVTYGTVTVPPVTVTGYQVSTVVSGGSAYLTTYGTQYGAGPAVTVTANGSVSTGNPGAGAYCFGSYTGPNSFYTSDITDDDSGSTIGYITIPVTPTITSFFFATTTAVILDTDGAAVAAQNDFGVIVTALSQAIPIGFGVATIYDADASTPITSAGTPLVTTYYATYGPGGYTGAPAGYGLNQSADADLFPSSGPGGTALATSYLVATDVINGTAMTETYGFVTVPEGFFYTDYPCYGQYGNPYLAESTTIFTSVFTITGVSIMTERSIFTSDGSTGVSTFTVTESFTYTFTQVEERVSTVISTKFSVSVTDMYVTVTVSPSSTSKYSTCRTAATNYAHRKKKRGLLMEAMESLEEAEDGRLTITPVGRGGMQVVQAMATPAPRVERMEREVVKIVTVPTALA